MKCPICHQEIEFHWIHHKCRDKLTDNEFDRLFTSNMTPEELKKIRKRGKDELLRLMKKNKSSKSSR